MTQWQASTFTTQDSLDITVFEPGGVNYKAWVQKKNGDVWEITPSR